MTICRKTPPIEAADDKIIPKGVRAR